jgi:phosphatidylserine decarboxylase
MRALGLAAWGFDELAIATIACGGLGFALWLALGQLAPWASYLGLLALIPWLIVLQFFRDPNREGPAGPGVMLSPADGTVTDIIEIEEPAYMQGNTLRIGIFLSPFNVHVNRSPCDAAVMFHEFRAGEFLPAYNAEAPTRNESCILGLITPEGTKFIVKQITGVLARRIICDSRPGSQLRAGERYGMIKFGSRTELYVPVEAKYELLVKIGDKVTGGQTVLCKRTVAAEAAPAAQTQEAVSV